MSQELQALIILQVKSGLGLGAVSSETFSRVKRAFSILTHSLSLFVTVQGQAV